MVAIRPDGAGDVTESHIIWKEGSGLPKVSSPLAAGGLVYTITAEGLLTCLDAGNRTRYYQHQFKDDTDHPISLHSSPALAGGRIYIIADDGLTSVIQAGKEFRLLDTASLGEPCHTCPAFAKGRIYIRGTEHLFCIASGTGVPPVSSPGPSGREHAEETHGRDAHAATNAPAEAH
jgi:outer membrane protein assembly factor BamB